MQTEQKTFQKGEREIDRKSRFNTEEIIQGRCAIFCINANDYQINQ